MYRVPGPFWGVLYCQRVYPEGVGHTQEEGTYTGGRICSPSPRVEVLVAVATHPTGMLSILLLIYTETWVK